MAELKLKPKSPRPSPNSFYSSTAILLVKGISWEIVPGRPWLWIGTGYVSLGLRGQEHFFKGPCSRWMAMNCYSEVTKVCLFLQESEYTTKWRLIYTSHSTSDPLLQFLSLFSIAPKKKKRREKELRRSCHLENLIQSEAVKMPVLFLLREKISIY